MTSPPMTSPPMGMPPTQMMGLPSNPPMGAQPGMQQHPGMMGMQSPTGQMPQMGNSGMIGTNMMAANMMGTNMMGGNMMAGSRMGMGNNMGMQQQVNFHTTDLTFLFFSWSFFSPSFKNLCVVYYFSFTLTSHYVP